MCRKQSLLWFRIIMKAKGGLCLGFNIKVQNIYLPAHTSKPDVPSSPYKQSHHRPKQSGWWWVKIRTWGVTNVGNQSFNAVTWHSRLSDECLQYLDHWCVLPPDWVGGRALAAATPIFRGCSIGQLGCGHHAGPVYLKVRALQRLFIHFLVWRAAAKRSGVDITIIYL